jgi:hypothetical protein
LAAIAGSCFAQDAGGDFHLSGTVTNSQTGQPVKQALILVRAPGPGRLSHQIPVLTDGVGNFSLTGLAAGTYSLTVQKNGYTSDPGMQLTSLVLGPSRDGVALRLVPLGIIAGKVTDNEGDPVPGVSVRALHAVLQDGRRSFNEDRSVSTDDRGQYRLWNLPPGDYYIVAAGRSGGTVTYFGPLSSGSVHEGFAPSYFQAAHDRASATPIAMTPGLEFTADLKIAMQPAYRVRGTLRNVSVRESVKVELLRGAGEVGSNRVLVNAATGRFEANDVVPGTYLLRASQGKGESEIRGEQQVQVGHTDVDGLVVELLPGVKVTGVVRGEPVLSARGRTVRARSSVTLTPAENDSSVAGPLRGFSEDDGTFTIAGVHAGNYRVHVQPLAGYVASLVSGAQDLSSGRNLVVGQGIQTESLEVVIRNDGGTIVGTIDGAVGAMDGAWVLLVPATGGDVERRIAVRGEFRFQELAPGDYQVYLLKDMDHIEYRNPEVLRGLKGGEAVHVTAGGSATVTLKVVAQ